MGRVVVLIIEGVAPALVERWMSWGVLPAFTALKENGTWGTLMSLPVPYEPPALLTAFTGASPGQHGCFSYWYSHSTTFEQVPQIVLAEEIPIPVIWQTDATAKLRVSIVNLFGTHPPSPVNGYLISYPLKPTLRACYPTNLLLELSRSGIHYGHDVSALYTGTSRNDFLNLIERIESARANACLDLLKRGGDLFVFNITIIERLSHFWWHEVEPDSGLADNDTALWCAYQFADDFLARIMDVMRFDDHLIIFSEIGFGPLKEYVSLNDILAQSGLLKIEEGYINPKHTIAMEAVQGSQGLNLNLKRHYSNGIVSEAEEESRMSEVCEALLSSVNPDTGSPFLKDVVRGSDLYPGTRANRAPDLVVIPYDERYLPLGHPYWAKKVHRQLQTGWHRQKTFWAGFGPRFLSHEIGIEASCADIAHTIAYCLGLPAPAPPRCQGKTLVSTTFNQQKDA